MPKWCFMTPRGIVDWSCDLYDSLWVINWPWKSIDAFTSASNSLQYEDEISIDIAYCGIVMHTTLGRTDTVEG